MGHEIYVCYGGRFVRVGEPRCAPEKRNFVIRCGYGDWSGFLSLPEAQAKFPALVAMGRADGYFSVVER